MNSEHTHLDAIAGNSLYAAGPSTAVVAYSFEVFRRFHRQGPILEVGPAEGIMTPLLAALDPHLHIVEGSELFCTDLKKRFPQAKVHHSLAEDFQSEERFGSIVLGHVLEHVLDPVAVLGKLARLLREDGIIYMAVPNSRSIHRQAGVLLGHLGFEEDMSDLDRHHGHRRVYNPETFRRDIRAAGLELHNFGGFWLKSFSDRQISSILNSDQLRSFFVLGERYPDIAAELYAVAGQPKGEARA